MPTLPPCDNDPDHPRAAAVHDGKNLCARCAIALLTEGVPHG